MRLLEITNDFPPVIGGIENYIFSLVSRWDPKEIVVLTRYVHGCEELDNTFPFQVVREPVGTLLPTTTLLRRARAIIEAEKIDAVHFASPLPLPLIGPQIRKSHARPYSVTLHGGEFVLASRAPVIRNLLRRALSNAAVLLCESNFVMEEARRFFGDSINFAFVPAGVDIERFKPGVPPAFSPPGSGGGGAVVVSVSRLVTRKGPATLIRSLPSVIARHPAAHALIVGGGPDTRRLQRLAESLGVRESVTFAGPKTWEEIPAYYSSGNIFALPTRARFGGLETEGLPLAFLEAAACGLPAVAGDAGGVTDAVVDGETGYVVDGSSSVETAAAILRLLDSPEQAEEMGRNARERVEREFTWDKAGERFRSALERYC